MSFAIIIPSNHEGTVYDCIATIHNHEPSFILDERIIVVTDGISVAPSAVLVEGMKPFIFSRNVNMGINAALATMDKLLGVFILNHDAMLETLFGITKLIGQSVLHPEYGILSAAINGANCNPIAMEPRGTDEIAETDDTVNFSAVFITRKCLDTIGLMDEDYTGYGFEDDHACWLARKAKFKVGVYHGCVFEHGSQPSSFRSLPDIHARMQHNREVFYQKWGHDNKGKK